MPKTKIRVIVTATADLPDDEKKGQKVLDTIAERVRAAVAAVDAELERVDKVVVKPIS